MKEDIFEPNQRMIILDALAGDSDYSMNNVILQKILVGMGHSVGLEKTDKEVGFLVSRGLVYVEKIAGTMKIVKLTQKGLDVAKGYEKIAGVERPSLK